MQVYTTVGAGAAGATSGVAEAAGTTGVAGATVPAVVCVVVAAGAEVFFAGAAGAVGAMVAGGVTALEFAEEVTGVALVAAGVVVSIGTEPSSTVLVANSAWLVFQAKLVTTLTNAVTETPSVAILDRRAGCGFRFMINHHPRLRRFLHHHRPHHHRRPHHLMDLDFRRQLRD